MFHVWLSANKKLWIESCFHVPVSYYQKLVLLTSQRTCCTISTASLCITGVQPSGSVQRMVQSTPTVETRVPASRQMDCLFPSMYGSWELTLTLDSGYINQLPDLTIQVSIIYWPFHYYSIFRKHFLYI